LFRDGKILAKKAIYFFNNYSMPQISNIAKYEIKKIRKFNSPYLTYDPPCLVLFITTRCNLSCSMCAFRSPMWSKSILEIDDMTMSIFKQIIDRFRRAIRLELTGGEPFLHRNIFEMIDYAHERSMEVKISTNGIVIHDMLDKVTHSTISVLNISLNACNNDEFFQVHGGSRQTYTALLQDISKLVKKRNRYNKNLRITISYVCTKENYKSIPKMVQLAEALEVDEVDFRNLIPYGIPSFLPNQCLYDDDFEVIDVIKSISRFKSNLEVVMPRLYKREHLVKKCNVPFRILTIYPKGDVSPCCLTPPQKGYGNAFIDTDVWNNSAFKRKRKLLIERSLPLSDFCKTCPGMVAEWRPPYVPLKKGIR
jgi:MoaA/NifB/PqqE/SkfB family radical SAM enzyme